MTRCIRRTFSLGEGLFDRKCRGALFEPRFRCVAILDEGVPCRVSANSIRSQCLVIIGRLGAFRPNACIPVTSSTHTVWVFWVCSNHGASRQVSQTSTRFCNCAGAVSVVGVPAADRQAIARAAFRHSSIRCIALPAREPRTRSTSSCRIVVNVLQFTTDE